MDKIENWTKIKLLTKIGNWTKLQMIQNWKWDKIENWTKLKNGQN